MNVAPHRRLERPGLFDRRQRRQLRRAATRAEELTSAFYCIRSREWPRFPYDVRTLADEPGPAARVFADVVRAAPREASTHRAPGERFRIRVRDDEILQAVGVHTGLELFPLLLYVLTHELVHVVRFSSGLARFETDDANARGREERRVHDVTRKVLRPAEDPRLRRVSALYG